jgi:hypothetical protein
VRVLARLDALGIPALRPDVTRKKIVIRYEKLCIARLGVNVRIWHLLGKSGCCHPAWLPGQRLSESPRGRVPQLREASPQGRPGACLSPDAGDAGRPGEGRGCDEPTLFSRQLTPVRGVAEIE